MSESTSTGTDTSSRRRRTRRPKTPFEFIDELKRDNVGATFATLRVLAMKEVREATLVDDHMTNVVFDYIRLGINERFPDVRRRPVPTLTRQERQDQRARTLDRMGDRLEQVIEARADLRMLEYITLIGKPLAECTGADCRKMATRDRDFYAEIARRLRPGERVGKHLSEDELQAIRRDCRLTPAE
jgi:hypothetical protein